jgi:hypothetical protein
MCNHCSVNVWLGSEESSFFAVSSDFWMTWEIEFDWSWHWRRLKGNDNRNCDYLISRRFSADNSVDGIQHCLEARTLSITSDFASFIVLLPPMYTRTAIDLPHVPSIGSKTCETSCRAFKKPYHRWGQGMTWVYPDTQIFLMFLFTY